jgi:TfoX/Sxy family transcriptional regulator of competence genes
MAYNEKLTARVRTLLEGLPKVEEKRMFRGMTFMVDGKMCVSVGDDRIMCRIDPALHADAVKRTGCRTVEMGGRPYIGFVYVNEKHLPTRKELAYWVGLALDFNGRAKSSKGRKRKPAARKAAGAARKAAPKTAQPSRGKAGKRARRA